MATKIPTPSVMTIRHRASRRSTYARFTTITLAIIAFLSISTYELTRFTRTFMQLPSVVWHKRWGGIELYAPAPDYRAARTIYPYSVVPGGLRNAAELEASMAKDPVVAAHYRDIAVSDLRATRLNAAVDVYSSFRSRSSVYWTIHTIHVPKGELVLSDGAHMIRARCGNRLTFVPPTQFTPTTQNQAGPPSEEPPPIEPPGLVFDYGLPSIYNPPVLPPPERESTPTSEVTQFWPPPVAPPIWCCEVGGFPGEWFPPVAGPLAPGRPQPVQTSQPLGTPEPGTLLLLSSGLTGVAWMLRRKTSCCPSRRKAESAGCDGSR